MTTQAGFNELLKDDTVIYAVLKKLHVTKAHNDYDDLVSEARLLYLKAYETNHDTGKRRFNYFFTKIYWGLLDYLRKQQRHHQAEVPVISAGDAAWTIIDERIDLHAGVEAAELLALVRTRCTEKEWFYVEQRLQGMKVAEIAAQIGVHSNTIYRRKARLRKKMAPLFEKINLEGGEKHTLIR